MISPKSASSCEPPRRRHGDAGLFGRAYIHLTEKAAELLGFVEEKNAPVLAQTSKSTSAGPTNSEADAQENPLLIPPSATVADGGIYKDLFPKNQKRQPGTLPLDLQRLLSLGFHKFLVFKLMREAKQHGKLLTEVVEVTWEHLSAAKRPISYLRSLLRSPVDFGHQLRSHHAKIHERRTRLNEIKAIDDLVARHAGQVFLRRSHQSAALKFLRMAARSPFAIAVSPALACPRPDGNSILPQHLEPVAC